MSGAADVSARLARVERLVEAARLEPDALTALAACLGDPDRAVRRRAADGVVALGRRGVAVRATLERTLLGASPGARAAAAFALAELGDPSSGCLRVLYESLGADDGDQRWGAAERLAPLAAHPEVEAALCALVAAGTPPQRRMALYCLREAAGWSARCEATARAALADPEAAVRLAALSTLGRRATDRRAAAQAVLPLLLDPAAGVRRAAAVALGTLGVADPEVTARLEAAAASADDALGRAAARALAELARRAGRR